MQVQAKQQTAFRFEQELISLMKRRASQRKISLNAYVTELIESDLRSSLILPKIKRIQKLDDDIKQFAGIAGIPGEQELEADERFARIWKR